MKRVVIRALFLIGAATLAGCSSGAAPQAGTGNYPPCNPDGGANPRECPTSWSDARSRCHGALANPCGSVGLRCGYPGTGDGVSDGHGGTCWATAVLLCAQVDGGGQWRCAQ
jgi:hypothetical protein